MIGAIFPYTKATPAFQANLAETEANLVACANTRGITTATSAAYRGTN